MQIIRSPNGAKRQKKIMSQGSKKEQEKKYEERRYY